ncbi:MAG TPA: high light inducible protein [Prochlorococcus sp.]
MASESPIDSSASAEPVSSEELNAWRRGFTPQAEIWNGRMAMAGLIIAISVLLLIRLVMPPDSISWLN